RFPEALAQRAALQQLRDDVWASLVRPNVENGEHVGMVERARRPRLLLEAPQLIVVVASPGEELDGDSATELDVATGEDAAHTPSAELAFKNVPFVQRPSRAHWRIVGSRR